MGKNWNIITKTFRSISRLKHSQLHTNASKALPDRLPAPVVQLPVLLAISGRTHTYGKSPASPASPHNHRASNHADPSHNPSTRTRTPATTASTSPSAMHRDTVARKPSKMVQQNPDSRADQGGLPERSVGTILVSDNTFFQYTPAKITQPINTLLS